MEEVIAKEFEESFSILWDFLPFLYIALIVMSAFAFEIVTFNGKISKYFYPKMLLICSLLATIGYLFYPEGKTTVNEIPNVIMGAVASILILRFIANRIQTKRKK